VAWIESHTTLDKHHKVINLRLAMRWSKNEAIGFLHRFWWTVLEVSPSGDITALSSPEVMAEMLDMPVEAMAKVLKVMEHSDPKLAFLERKNGRLLVHDWLDYAGQYLSNSRYRRSPEKYEEIKRIHQVTAESPPGSELSADSSPTVGRTLPTLPNQEKDLGGSPPAPPERPPGASQVRGEGKPKAGKPYPPESTPYKAARFFWEAYVREWAPSAKPPTDAGLQTWARDCDLMFRVDRRSTEEFNALLDWIDQQPPGHKGFTWRKNVLCPATLRARWNEGKFADFLSPALSREEYR